MPFFKSASSFRSESSDGDLEGIAEGELAKLQRQFRLLEGDRHAYALESRETIRRQTVEVKRLEKENEDLRYKQAVAEGHANQKKEKAQSEILRSLLAERDAMKEQIMKEKKRITRLDQEIETWENRLADRKQMMGSDSMIQEQRAHLQRKIQTVENQLDKITSEFSSQLVLNSQLREDLEILRVGHDHFEQQHKDLEEELLETRKTIINVVSTSSAAYDARDEAHARLGQLRDKAEKDLKQYISEMKELERFLENDRRVSEFVNIKLQERTFTEEALRAKAKKQEERRRKDSEEELLESYSNAFDKLLELTGSKDLNMALDTFVKDRERNFAQFNYVNEQNSQKDRLWEEIHELCHEIQEIQKRNSQREAQQLLQLHETEGQQEETVKEANQAEQNVKKFLKIWEQLKSAIESLFWKLECDHSSLEKVLGGTTTAQDENVAIYLSIIERKVNMLLTMYSYKKAEEKDEPYDTVETAQLLLGQTPGLRPTAITVRPPTAGLGHEPIQEEDNRPLTHEELREKVIKEIQSKAAALSLKKST